MHVMYKTNAKNVSYNHNEHNKLIIVGPVVNYARKHTLQLAR